MTNGSTTSDGFVAALDSSLDTRRWRSRLLVEQHAEDANRPGDVLEALFPHVLERDVEAVADLVAHGGGDADAAGGRQLLQAGRNVDAVAEDVAVLDDHVAEVDADPELDPARRRNVRVAPRHSALDFGGALHGVGNALEFHQHAVAGGLDDAALALGDRGVEELDPVGLEPREGARLVGFHEPAVTDHVSRENRRQPPCVAVGFHRACLAHRGFQFSKKGAAGMRSNAGSAEGVFFDSWRYGRGGAG